MKPQMNTDLNNSNHVNTMENKSYKDHGCYADEQGRKLAALWLFKGAYEMFHKAYRIKHIKKFERFIKKCQTTKIGHWFHKEAKPFTEENLLDCIKICIAFESYIKAVLLLKEYLIHRIDSNSTLKNFYRKQKDEPVAISEFEKLSDWVYDVESKYYKLSNLLNTTLSFSMLLNKPAYQEIVGLPKDILNRLNIKNEERNTLHFYSGDSAAYSLSSINTLNILNNFVNDKIVPIHNKLVRDLKLPPDNQLIKTENSGDAIQN